MKPFLSGVILALLIAVPTAAILLRRVKRQAGRREALQTGPDETLTRLTGELAHEIKNPLSTIKVNLKLTKEALEDIDLREPNKPALDRCQQGLSSAMRKITIIQKETDRLEQIVDGFLRYVKRPDLHLVTMDLNELVGDMVDFYLPQAYSHSLTLRHSLAAAPLICRVDAGALKQVLLNLLINAQQAMDRGGELMIRTRSRSGKAVIQIDDTGRGIPAEKLPTLFQPYCSFRAGGTGLGLATAKKIVESHGGTISVHSEVGKGTSFTIELPLAGAGCASDEVNA